MTDASRIIRRRWTAAEDDIIRVRYGELSAADLGALIDRTEDAIWLRARNLGLDKRQEEARPWTAAELDEVRNCYSAERPADIASRLGRTTSAVSQQAKCLGVVSAKRLIVLATIHDYFAEVSTAEQAYILGLLAADGCVSDRHPRITFGQQSKDAELVRFIRDRLNPEANLHRTPNGFTVLQVTSAQTVADLARFGIVPRKSRILTWPCHLGDLLRPFLLGYFDGDGSMYLPRDNRGRERPGWTVCSGTEPFLIEMKDYILTAAGVALQKIQHRKDSDLWQVAVTGKRAIALDEWLHQDGLGLPRKKIPERVLTRYRVASPDHDATRPGLW